jgi:DNA-binding CsgD family transcriptional regulator
MVAKPHDPGSELLARLSPREREVLEMASLGLTNGEVALRLAVTVHAVKFHLASVYRKLGVTNRTQATMTFYRAGGSAPDAGATEISA